MDQEEATAASRPTRAVSEKLFTVDQANRALVLVHRIVADIVKRYGGLFDLRTQRHELASVAGQPQQLQKLHEKIEGTLAELHRLHEELAGIGCVLKDWAGGMVDFPGVYCGRRVWLCWRLGEPAVTHWHDLEAGFAGRQPVGPDFA